MREARDIQQQVLAAYESYEFRRVHQLLYDFCNDTLSATYCAAVKDRLYCDAADADRRRSTQRTMFVLVEMLSRLLAPIMPHTQPMKHIARCTIPTTRCRPFICKRM